jgi:hypothetical protein
MRPADARAIEAIHPLFAGMTKIEEIEKAVAALPPQQLERFRAWFADIRLCG